MKTIFSLLIVLIGTICSVAQEIARVESKEFDSNCFPDTVPDNLRITNPSKAVMYHETD